MADFPLSSAASLNLVWSQNGVLGNELIGLQHLHDICNTAEKCSGRWWFTIGKLR